MTRTTDPDTLRQLEIAQQSGAGIRTASGQFKGVYDAQIHSVDTANQTCMVTLQAFNGSMTPLGPTPYYQGEPTVGAFCVVAFVSPVSGSQPGILPRFLSYTGSGIGSSDISPLMLMGA